MEKKKKIILVTVIIMIIILVASFTIFRENNQNNLTRDKFNNGVPINISFTSMDYNVVENEIKNKVKNKWTDLDNKIDNYYLNRKNSSNPLFNNSKGSYKKGSTVFNGGYETWDYYVFKIKYSELSKTFKDSSIYKYAYLIINKNNGISHLYI